MTAILTVAALGFAATAAAVITRHDRDATTLLPSVGQLTLEGVLIAGAIGCALPAAVSIALRVLA